MILSKNALAIVGTCGLAMALSGCNGALLQAIADNEDPTPVHAYNAAGPLLPNANPLTTATVSKTGQGQGVGVETLVIDVDGQHYELPMVSNWDDLDIQSDGRQDVYANSANIENATLIANQYAGQYASLVFMLEMSNELIQELLASEEGLNLGDNADWPEGVGGFALIATGTVETPVGNLPAQIISYQGVYILAVAENGALMAGGGRGGTFNAQADFTNNTVAIQTDRIGGGVVTIVGNRFGGAFTGGNDELEVAGQIAGGFYGPGAEEIAAAAGGTFTDLANSETYDFAAGFLGWQQDDE